MGIESAFLLDTKKSTSGEVILFIPSHKCFSKYFENDCKESELVQNKWKLPYTFHAFKIPDVYFIYYGYYLIAFFTFSKVVLIFIDVHFSFKADFQYLKCMTSDIMQSTFEADNFCHCFIR